MKRLLKKSVTTKKKKMTNPPSLYIHIPFCENICDYCDFAKLQYFRFLAEKYLASLEKELDGYQINHPLKTIYIGGGTPTSLEDDLFEKLLMMVSKYTKGVIEYTIEANPESLSLNKILLMKKYGVNRLSIGVESTDDALLKAINRHHTFDDVKTAIKLARENGISNINVDLILGLPHASKKMLEKDIDNIISLGVDHISCYGLTVHPNTVFFLNGIQEPLEDDLRDYYDYLDERLEKEDFSHYEVSNWAKLGKMSQHNLTYWRNDHYYGVGLGASGYINDERYTNTRSITKYLDGHFVDQKEILSKKDEKSYQIMLNLRTIEGINLVDYKKKFNEDFYHTFRIILDEYITQKYLIYDESKQIIYPSYSGMMILDNLLVKLFEELDH